MSCGAKHTHLFQIKQRHTICLHWSTLSLTVAAKVFSKLHISLVDSILLRQQAETDLSITESVHRARC